MKCKHRLSGLSKSARGTLKLQNIEFWPNSAIKSSANYFEIGRFAFFSSTWVFRATISIFGSIQNIFAAIARWTASRHRTSMYRHIEFFLFLIFIVTTVFYFIFIWNTGTVEHTALEPHGHGYGRASNDIGYSGSHWITLQSSGHKSSQVVQRPRPQQVTSVTRTNDDNSRQVTTSDHSDHHVPETLQATSASFPGSRGFLRHVACASAASRAGCARRWEARPRQRLCRRGAAPGSTWCRRGTVPVHSRRALRPRRLMHEEHWTACLPASHAPH